MLKERRATRPVPVGNLVIGGGHPVSLQSMTTTPTRDVAKTAAQIQALEAEGVEIIRVAVPDRESLAALDGIKALTRVPLVADIHFSHTLALGALERQVDKLRINPGNIGGVEKFARIAERAKERGIALRIGVNAGSLSREALERWGGPTPEAMVAEALNYIAVLERVEFNRVVVSLKAADVVTTIRAYRLFSEKADYPLHIGITEAGTPFKGAIKSAVGLGYLLLEGLGDTLRVSLSGDPLEEVRAAKEILQAAGVRLFGPEIISCPTCGRCGVDLLALVGKVEEGIKGLKEPVKIAVMGCPVNGPGEARQADFGIAGEKGSGIIFKKGQVVRKVREDRLVPALLEVMRETLNWG
jgi:(E)-4-hydroxy-3-methylbut-2-enyl-diphosphate synthase